MSLIKIYTANRFDVDLVSELMTDLGYTVVIPERNNGRYMISTTPDLTVGHKTAMTNMFTGGGFYCIITP